jgi:D-3-phosphoglycerate dehydrogenase / 2-oxoglutarate reductase
MDRAMKSGAWYKPPGVALNECTLGVVGVGNVGRAVVRRAISFGLRVLGNDIQPIDPEFLVATGLEVMSLPELLAAADFVSINCDLNPTSLRLIDRDALASMRPTSVLVNTARGPIVDETALAAALREGAIAGAALDVFEIEPLPESSPLRAMDNVLLAPHNSNTSPRAWARVHERTIQNLFDVLEGADR